MKLPYLFTWKFFHVAQRTCDGKLCALLLFVILKKKIAIRWNRKIAEQLHRYYFCNNYSFCTKTVLITILSASIKKYFRTRPLFLRSTFLARSVVRNSYKPLTVKTASLSLKQVAPFFVLEGLTIKGAYTIKRASLSLKKLAPSFGLEGLTVKGASLKQLASFFGLEGITIKGALTVKRAYLSLKPLAPFLGHDPCWCRPIGQILHAW